MGIEAVSDQNHIEARETEIFKTRQLLQEFRSKAAVARRLPLFYPNSDGLPIRKPFDEGWVIRPYQFIEDRVISGLAVSAYDASPLAYEFFPVSNGLVAYNIEPVDLRQLDFGSVAQALAEATAIVDNVSYLEWALHVPYVSDMPNGQPPLDLPAQRQGDKF